MPTAVITGANRGLGLEFVRQYVADGWQVVACCRNPEKATDLQTVSGDVRVMALDVSRDHEISALGHALSDEPVDLLINNAGVYGPKPCDLTSVDSQTWHDVMAINAFSPLLVSRALLGSVAAAGGKVATLTSKMGSMADNGSGGSYVYRSSKAALNAVMKSFAIDVAGQGIATVILHPGWVRTDMGGPNGLIDAPESVSGMRRVIEETSLANTGQFIDFAGKAIPW